MLGELHEFGALVRIQHTVLERPLEHVQVGVVLTSVVIVG
jgi:hypothetical protein